MSTTSGTVRPRPAGAVPLGPGDQVRRTMFRVLAVLRVVVLLYAVWVNEARMDRMDRPGLAWAALGAMALWTVVANVFYERRRRPPLWFFVLDVAVACGFFVLTLATHGEAMWSRGGPSLPTLWVMGSVLAVAGGLGWWQGLLAGASVSLVDVAFRARDTYNTTANIFLLLLAAAAVGAMSTALCRAAEVRATAVRLQASIDERARLSRAVHDGVLQVLSMVQRDSADPALARLAGEQEASLRALVQYDARAVAGGAQVGGAEDSGTDLVHALEQVTGRRPLSAPSTAVLLPERVVRELVAAVTECLVNVDRHVGKDAPAWVLVEELDDEVVVTVRDEGPGIAEDRLARAAAEGRLGVSGSIRGRLHDLGGRAELTTGPSLGTEWELVVPRQHPDPHRPGGAA